MIRIAAAIALFAAPALAHAQALEGALKKIRDTKTITIAYRTDAVPFSFADAKSAPAGYTVDICKRIVASLEQQLKLQGLQVNWMAATSQNRLELVAKRQADMECGATTATLSRMEMVDFSSFVFADSTGVLVRNDAGVQRFSDLAGKRVAVIAGTTNEKALGEALRKDLVNATVVTVKNRDEGLKALEAGQVQGFASDKVLIVGLSGKVKDPTQYTMLQENLSFEPYAIVLPHGDAQFRLAVNRALAQLYRSPAIGEVWTRWFGALGKPTDLLITMYLMGAIPE